MEQKLEDLEEERDAEWTKLQDMTRRLAEAEVYMAAGRESVAYRDAASKREEALRAQMEQVSGRVQQEPHV
jgi:hypothetical protein